MREDEILDYLMGKFIEKLRPTLYEIVTECLSKQPAPVSPDVSLDDLLTIKEVTDFFGCAKTTVYAWRKRGLIKTKKIGNKTYCKRSEIQRLIK